MVDILSYFIVSSKTVVIKLYHMCCMHFPCSSPSPLPPRVADDDVTPNTITISIRPSLDSNGKVV